MTTTTYPSPGVALLSFGAPGSLNLWTPELEGEFFAALDQVAHDPAVRVIAVRSAGKLFCGGADLAAIERRLAALDDPAVEAERMLARRVTRARAIPKPVLVGVHGACVGIGLAFALTADVRIAARDTVFRTVFAERGFVAEHGVSWLLPRLVGASVAADLLLTGRALTAEEALAVGLVSRVVEPADLSDALLETAAHVASSVSPRSAAVIKRQLAEDAERPFTRAVEEAAHETVRAFAEPDAREGVRAFLERRAPRFADYAPEEPGGRSDA